MGNCTDVVFFTGLWFGQYDLGWNGKFDDWTPLFTSPEADAFHNSIGIEFSVAHQMDLKDPGNTYKTQGQDRHRSFPLFQLARGGERRVQSVPARRALLRQRT